MVYLGASESKEVFHIATVMQRVTAHTVSSKFSENDRMIREGTNTCSRGHKKCQVTIYIPGTACRPWLKYDPNNGSFIHLQLL